MKKLPISTILIFFFAAVVYAVGAATRAGVPGMVFDRIRESLGITAAQTSGISSAGVFGCMVFLGISGVLIDRFGWRKVILAGIVLQVAGEWLLYTFTSLPVVYAGAFVNGGGRTIGYLTLLKFLDTEFDRKYFSVLIGVFYIFSYGGTLLGSSPFESLATDHSWQTVLRWANHLTTVCGVAVALCMLTSGRCDHAANATRTTPRKFPWKDLLGQLRKPQCLCVFYCAATGIVIYWSCLSVFGKKYLSDLCGVDASAIGVMNTLVMIEMIFAGSVSFLFGNRRKIFQLAGCALLAAGCAVLFGGTCLNSPELARRSAWAGFLLLGAGYGFTCIQISACREFVPPEFAASAIAFVNFCANILIIALSQVAGSIFDKFQVADSLQATPPAFRIILGICLVLAVPAAVAALALPDSRGRNISAEL